MTFSNSMDVKKEISYKILKSFWAHLAKRGRSIRQQISTLQASRHIQALAPLVQIGNSIIGQDVTLTDFQVTEDKEIKATFLGGSVDELQKLAPKLQALSFSNIQVNIDETAKRLVMTATETKWKSRYSTN